jgi:hypothetical protein
MKTSNMVIEIYEYGDNRIGTSIKATVSDANKASEIAKKLQDVNDLQKGDYKYAVTNLTY